MTRALAFALLAIIAVTMPARGQTPRARTSARQYLEADSVRLDQHEGYFGGPEYQIVIDKLGRVAVRPDSLAVALFRVAPTQPDAFPQLMRRAIVVLFSDLPDTLATDPVFGRACGTDAPTTVITVYHALFLKRVVDYQGCYWAPVGIRELEQAIERTAGKRQE